MAKTTVTADLKVKQWDDAFFREYVRANQFSALMGTDENSIIQVREDLTKKPGDRIVMALIKELTGAGVSGTATLEGNEEHLVQYAFEIAVSMKRQGVRIHKFEEQLTAIDMRNAARAMLKTWSMKELRDTIIAKMLAPSLNGTVYASATESQKDAWVAANADRIFFGALSANNSSNDHSASLSNVDSSSDKLTTDLVSKMKRAAKTISPVIRPVMIDGSGEHFVLLAPTTAFRDLKQSSAMQQAMRDALVRGKDNPIFQDGDMLWEGVVIKEIPEIPVISGVGASSIDVAPVFFCGAQAVACAWAQRTQTKTEMFDYDVEYGVSVEEVRGIEKMYFNNVQHGMLTAYVSGVADV